MTTIAFDGKELVADTRGTNADTIMPGVFKKIHLPEEGDYWEVMGKRCIAFGLAGMLNAIEDVKDMLRAGVTHKTRFPTGQEVTYNALFITEDGEAWGQSVFMLRGVLSTYLSLTPPPCAIGSGDIYAYSLLAIGKTAQQAVKGASRLDPYTNDQLSIFVLPPTPEIPSKRPVPEPVAEEPSRGAAEEAAQVSALKKMIREELEETLKANKPSEEYKEAERDAGRPKVAPSQTLGWNRM